MNVHQNSLKLLLFLHFSMDSLKLVTLISWFSQGLEKLVFVALKVVEKALNFVFLNVYEQQQHVDEGGHSENWVWGGGGQVTECRCRCSVCDCRCRSGSVSVDV